MLFPAEKKAQAVIVDLLIGIALFLIVVTAGIAILDNQSNAILQQQQMMAQQSATDSALIQLVSSAGMDYNGKTNWEDSITIDEVKFIGLAVNDRVVFPEKINKFKQYSITDYEKAKSKLLIAQDFYFRLIVPETGINGTTMNGCPDESSACEAGKTENYLIETEGKKISSIIKSRRIVAYNGGSAIAEITVFKTS